MTGGKEDACQYQKTLYDCFHFGDHFRMYFLLFALLIFPLPFPTIPTIIVAAELGFTLVTNLRLAGTPAVPAQKGHYTKYYIRELP